MSVVKLSVLKGLEPSKFFHYFEEISNIPRGSYNEKQISDYIANFAKERNLEYFQDELYSILVKKPGTSGYENSEPVIFHGHMDMVCYKNENVDIDFEKEGLKLKIDGDFIKADGTTLGADNGVGVAYVLALLDSDDIPHPPLEIILTVQEEVGKVGAQNFDVSRVTGKRLIDLNWHDPKSLFAGCAGDISARFLIPVNWSKPTEGLNVMSLKVNGLRGGHSEFDIHLERANAIVLLGRLLNSISIEADIEVANLSGGVNRYVIPSEAEAIILINPSDESVIKKIVDQEFKDFKNEFAVSDPDVNVIIEPSVETIEQVYTKESFHASLSAILLIPNGVQSMSLNVPGLVESSNTIAILTTYENELEVLNTIPSAVTSRKYAILHKLQLLARQLGNGSYVSTFADCPEWPYNENSQMLKIAQKAYRDLFNEDAHVEVSHSSLELGFFASKIPGVDMISMGPEAFGVHTTEERLNYTTVAPVWELLKEVLKNLR